jgi:cytochrome c oxidase subunit II
VATQNTPVRTRNIQRAVIIWAVASVLGELIFYLLAPHLIDWHVLPAGASDRSDEINNVLGLFTIASIPVFMLVVVFAIYSVISYGSRVRPQVEGPAVVVNPRLQGIWIIASVVLVAFLYVYGLAFLNQVNAQPTGNVLHVSVTGEQWLWDYTYTDPQYGGIYGTTLELPVNVPVIFTIQSIDVQHSFWIPAFGIKQDAVPGETTSISATPKVIGDYVVRCAELCGIYHAYMETPVHVVSQSDFDSWVRQQPTPVPSPSSSGYAPPDLALTGIASRRAA